MFLVSQSNEEVNASIAVVYLVIRMLLRLLVPAGQGDARRARKLRQWC